MPFQHAKLRKLAIVLATLGAAFTGLATATSVSSTSVSSVHVASHHTSKSAANRPSHHTIIHMNNIHASNSHTVNKTHTANTTIGETITKTHSTNATGVAIVHTSSNNAHLKQANHPVTRAHLKTKNKLKIAGHHKTSSVHHASVRLNVRHREASLHHHVDSHHPHHANHTTQPIIAPIALNTATDMNNNATIELADSASESNNFNADSTLQTNMDKAAQPTARAGQRLVAFVHSFMSSLRYTTYKSGGEVFDITHGVYEVDCSHYVNHILQDVFPRAYSSLEVSTGAQTPNSANYYNFFSHLSSNLKLDWNRVDDAKDLQPGDILVFRYRRSSGAVDGGHVMLVMNKPTMDNGALLVQVSDSAFAGHGDDTRRGSGVGIGTLKLKINPYTGQPSAYAWEQDAPWQSRVNIAMGRPEDVG